MSAAMRMFIPLTKVDIEQRLVIGVATGETPDRSGEICDYASSKPYFKAWSSDIEKSSGGKSLGNVRAMHGHTAAGKVTAIDFDDDEKQIVIAAKIVDDAEWEKVVEGVYTGFSQGGRYVKRWPDPGSKNIRYTADPREISLVDLPCLPEATFSVIKADGISEARHFKVGATEEDEMAKAKVDEPASPEVTPTEDEIAKAAVAATEVIDAVEPEVESPAVVEDPVAKASAAVDKLTAALVAAESIEKGMYSVSQFADVISSVSYLMKSGEYEADAEGDNSKVPGLLRDWLTKGIEIFKAMAAEETAELLADSKAKKAAAIEGLEKAAEARLAQSATDALAKAETERDGFAKALGDIALKVDPLVKTVDTLAKRLAAMEDRPVPLKTVGPGATLSVSKEADAAGGVSGSVEKGMSDEDVKKAFDSLSPEDQTLALIKATKMFPHRVTYR